MRRVPAANHAAATAEIDEAEKAFSKILRCASVREQSSVKMRAKLLQAGMSEESIDSSLARAVRVGAIDDLRYCNALVRATVSAGKGLKLVEREVEELGFSLDELEAYQDHLECGPTDLERALEIIERHPPRAKNKRDAAYRKLVSKGFSSDVAATAARSAFPSCVCP